MTPGQIKLIILVLAFAVPAWMWASKDSSMGAAQESKPERDEIGTPIILPAFAPTLPEHCPKLGGNIKSSGRWLVSEQISQRSDGEWVVECVYEERK